MSLEAPPPSRHISSTPISLASASTMLDTYLRNSEVHPHLHPDALITPTGVIFSSHGGPTGGVVLHNLRRVAAGLRGEYLEPERTPEPEEGEEDADAPANGVGMGKKSGKTGGARKNAGAGQWVDNEQYEYENPGLQVGDVGERGPAVHEGGEEPEVQATGGAQEGRKRKQDAEGGAGVVLSKDARKKAKKERDLQRKRENEKKNANKDE